MPTMLSSPNSFLTVRKVVAYGSFGSGCWQWEVFFSKFHHVANFFVSDCSNFELLSAVCESTTQECAACLFSCQCEEGKVLIVGSSFVSVKNSRCLPLSHSVQGCHIMYHLLLGKSFCGTHENVHLRLWDSMTSSNSVCIAWQLVSVQVYENGHPFTSWHSHEGYSQIITWINIEAFHPSMWMGDCSHIP